MLRHRTSTLLLSTVLLLVLMAAAVDASSGRKTSDFRAFEGNTLTGEAGQIRGIDAGGLPWVVDRAEATLREDGRLDVRVRGLVIDPALEDPSNPGEPHPLAGTNPVPDFRAAVSCLTLDEATHAVVNVFTDPAPASPEGDARIRATVMLPDPCLAPIVFVTSPGEAWFAVSAG